MPAWKWFVLIVVIDGFDYTEKEGIKSIEMLI